MKSGSSAVPVEIDILALGSARNELTLTLTGLSAAKSTLRTEETRLGKRLAGRMRP